MSPLFIGIPILNRLDLLSKCLEAIDHPAQVVIVNNNAVDPVFARDLAALAAAGKFEVLNQKRNLGVAASWNLIARTAFERGHDRVCIGSNDTLLHPGSLAAADAMTAEPRDGTSPAGESPAGADRVGVWHLHSWNFFLLLRSTIEEVGWFDENFYPAYKEDQDYSYRCTLAGLGRVNVPGAGAEHVGSATINSNPRYAALNVNTQFNWNLNHYKMKWGGDAGAERFTHPYDKQEHDHRWWPDPGGSIEFRDWDRPG